MAYPKGAKRPEGAGRKKGTPNRKTQELLAKCEASGVDPFDVLLLICKGIEEMIVKDDKGKEKRISIPVKTENRLAAAKELCQYLYPKRKAIELTSEEDKAINVTIVDYGSEDCAPTKTKGVSKSNR